MGAIFEGALGFLKQESAMALVVSVAAITWAWKEGAPPFVIGCIAGNTLAFIVMEKWRSVHAKKEPTNA